MMSNKIISQSALILAGGNSTRMGRNKALLPYNHKTVIAHIVHVLSSTIESIYISAGGHDNKLYSNLGVPVISDIEVNQGPIQGIITGLKHCATDWVFVVSVDSPSVDPQLVLDLWKNHSGYDAVIAIQNKIRMPLIGWYKRSTLPKWERGYVSGSRRIMPILNSINVKQVEVDSSYMLNMNTIDEYKNFLNEC